MGIPRFFINIIKKYKETHFRGKGFKFQNLFMDYNAFLYQALKEFSKKYSYGEIEKLSEAKRETLLSEFITEKTINYVNELQPERLLYIAFDGPAPRSKMKLQRYRRYGGFKNKQYLEELKKEYKIEEKSVSSFFNSAIFSPGTSFMEKMAKQLVTASKKKKFMGGKISVIINDTNIPGEGEHKILNFIRKLKNLKDKIVIFSPDADMVVLSIQYEGDIYIIQDRDINKEDHVLLYPDDSVKYIVFSVTNYKKALKKEFSFIDNINEIRLSRDIILLSFFVGNDFVKPIFFTKSNKNYSFPIILNTYKKLLPKYKNTDEPYLVKINNDATVNHDFFVDIVRSLAFNEDNNMKKYYRRLLYIMDKELEKVEDTYETKVASYIHDPYYVASNPFYELDLFKKIDYNQHHNIWKNQYYSEYFGLTLNNMSEFSSYKNLVCQKYLQSLIYCLRYYLTGLPSWDWYYPFRVSPMPSDILYFMKNTPKDLDFKFTKGKPYQPIEQLAMIIPPQYSNMLPKPLKNLINDPKSPLAPFYPIDFEFDKLVGEKREYSYPRLPPFIDEYIRPVIKETFSKFTKTEKKRNTLNTEYTLYDPSFNYTNNLLLDNPRNIK